MAHQFKSIALLLNGAYLAYLNPPRLFKDLEGFTVCFIGSVYSCNVYRNEGTVVEWIDFHYLNNGKQ